MPKQYSPRVRERAVKMVLSHLDEYGSVYKAAFAIGPKVGVQGESLRRWVVADLAKDTPAGVEAEAQRAESKRVKELERKVKELEEANDILLQASIFFAGELCAVRRRVVVGGVRPPAPGSRSCLVKPGGSPTGVIPVLVGWRAAPTSTSRAGTVRRCGVVRRDQRV